MHILFNHDALDRPFLTFHRQACSLFQGFWGSNTFKGRESSSFPFSEYQLWAANRISNSLCKFARTIAINHLAALIIKGT